MLKMLRVMRSNMGATLGSESTVAPLITLAKGLYSAINTMRFLWSSHFIPGTPSPWQSGNWSKEWVATLLRLGQ
eukprot:15235-Pyramimonas_sp.AAC.1